MKFLVTGVGFIGSHLVDRLISDKHEVVGIDNLSTGDVKNINPACKFIKADINDDLTKLFEQEKFDYVYHLAAQTNLRKSIEFPKQDAETNIRGSLNVIENARKFGVKKFFFVSTGAIIKSNCYYKSENDCKIKPKSQYALSKYVIEQHLQLYKELYGFQSSTFRLSNVYGSRQNPQNESGVISIFKERIKNNQNLTIYGGSQIRNFINVYDVTNGLMIPFLNAKRIASTQNNKYIDEQYIDEQFLNRRLYHLCSDDEISIIDLANKMIQLSGKNIKIEKKKMIDGEVKISRMSTNLPEYIWKPQVTLDQGLKDYLYAP
jgi:UDP-glucose 4-epimerase